MAEHNGYWGIEGTLYEFPMTVEIDEDKAGILSITVPVEEKDGKTVNLRFVPDDENEKLRKLVAQLIRCARVGKENVSHYQPTRDGCGFDCVANGEHCSFAKICDHARAV